MNSGPARARPWPARTSGTLLPVLIAHVKQAEVLDACAGTRLRPRHNLPLPAEPVEIVDKVAAHVRLQRLVDLADSTPCLRTLSRSTLTKTCGTLGRKVVLRPASSGRLRAASMNVSRFVGKKRMSLPGRSSRMKVKPPAVPTPGMAGGGKENAFASGRLASSRFRCAGWRRTCSLRASSFIPRFQGHEKDGAVGGLRLAQQAEPQYGRIILDAGCLGSASSRPCGKRRRCAARKPRWGSWTLMYIALVFLGQKPGRQLRRSPRRQWRGRPGAAD